MRSHPTATSRIARLPFLAALTLALAAPDGAQAQSSLTVAAGPSLYDLSGTGTGVVGAVRYETTLSKLIVFEAGSALFRYETQAGRTDNLILPEIGLPIVFPLGGIRGYIGTGAGAHVTLKQERAAEKDGHFNRRVDLRRAVERGTCGARSQRGRRGLVRGG